jgi:hypothetical protein
LLRKAAEIAMSFHQQLQHLGVVVDAHRAQCVVTQRRDRDGSGVVRIVLLGTARSQQSGACRQHGGHVDDGLAGGDELLSEEVAEPAGRLDCPHSIRECCRPAPQLIGLRAAGSNPDFVEDVFGAVDRDCGVGCLMRIDANGDRHSECSLSR